MKKILVLNTGSSSIKFKIFELGLGNELIVEKEGDIAGIGLSEGPKNHQIALSLLFEGFGLHSGALNKIDGLVAIAHRIIHSCDEYIKPVLINKKVIKNIAKYSMLEPLHTKPILKVIESVYHNSGKSGHRTIPNYAVSDSSLYHNLPDKAKYYPISKKCQERYQIRRIGFHGLSHNNSYQQIILKYGRVENMISLHLGAGCSITAFKNGRVIDTSMGLTPLEGLMMGTRPGDIDPGIILFLLSKRWSTKDVSNLLNHQSGLLGVSGASSDMKDILYLAGEKVEDEYKPKISLSNLSSQYHNDAKLALEMFIYKIQKYIGAYSAALGGVDVLAFTGKIGVGSSVIRERILADIKHLINGVKIEVISTDEEQQIVKEIIPLI
ncbi:MAG: hypothetical protein ACD_58C00122G0004 [uncultured bacterium]|nr:MAG: hypothetical protein ACD_58C00122G0004 [uncultured bacterium]